MSTTQADSKTPARDVPVGTTVIFTGGGGTYRYDGPHDMAGSFQIQISFGKELSGLRCPPEQVAPAGTPIPLRSDRVSVVKRERGHYPTWEGPWLLSVDGKGRGFYKTKRDGTAAGLLMVAVADWHAAGGGR